MLKVHAFILVSLVLNVTKADHLPFSDVGCYKSYDKTSMSDFDFFDYDSPERCFNFCRKSKWVGMNSHQCFCGSYFGGPKFSGLLFTEKVNRSECSQYYKPGIISLYRQGKYSDYWAESCF